MRIWEEIDGLNIIEGGEVKLSQLTPSCGMGCNKREKWNMVFTNTRMKRVIMSNDSYKYDVTTRRVTDILIQNIPTTMINRNSIWSILEDKESIIKNGVIYTDGSWKDMRKKENILFRTGEKESSASAAVVIVNKSEKWKENEAIVIRLKARSDDIKDQINKAFIMELIAILAATQILSWFNLMADIRRIVKELWTN